MRKETIAIITEDMLAEFYFEYDEIKTHTDHVFLDEDGNETESMSVMMQPIRKYWAGRSRSLDRVKEIFDL